jgi:hypothetical protein
MQSSSLKEPAMFIRFYPVVSLFALSMAAAYPAAAQAPQPAPAAQPVAAVAAHPSAAAKLLEVKAQLTALQANVNATTAALNKMSKAARNEGDLAAAHKEFMAHYQALDAQMNAIRQMGTAARTGSDEYFKSWQAAVATIQNKDIRESAVERLNTAKERYARVLSMADEGRQKVQPFLTDMKDINTLLSIDMTPDAVKSVSGSTWRISRSAEEIVDSIAEINRSIDIMLESLPKN